MLKNIRKLSILAMFISISLVLHVVEGMLPIPMVAPGVKLGLANIVTLMAIILFGLKEVLLIVFIRCLLGSLFVGGVSGFFFSITGGILSGLIMWFVYSKFRKYFSILGISVIGAIFHNIGQLFVASIIISDFRIYVYLPILMTSSVITGIFTGLICSYMKNLLINNINKLGWHFNDK